MVTALTFFLLSTFHKLTCHHLTLFITLFHQFFSVDYSQKYLKEYPREPVVVPVTNEYYKGSKNVRFMMGKSDGRAIMTQNWGEVVKDAMMEEKEMAVFRFTVGRNGRLKVNVASA